jgi:predicted CXXCH cytochrome family protein
MPKHKKIKTTAAAPSTPTAAEAKPAKRPIPLIIFAVALLISLPFFLYRQHSTVLTPPATVAPAPAVSSAAKLPPASFVDEAQCTTCHGEQSKAWAGSHHQMAMQPANAATVLGDFKDTTYTGEADTSHFSQRDGAFWINTPGADGKPADFKVAYTFGVAPLQQYLLELPGGRLQASGVAWDTQKQRWFELYPGEKVDFRDDLHWSKPSQNANFMCVECHTTNFKRNFSPVADSFNSNWNNLGVGCQSCHGPASRHVQWSAGENLNKQQPDKGFGTALANRDALTQVETCGRCHARRAPLGDGYTHANRLMDDYLPATLSADLYQVDGKIKEEVFEYGSFTQSKMFAKGVTCTDCHNPHSNELKAPGNGVCLQCHNPSGKPVRAGIDGAGLKPKDYQAPEHTKHKAGQPGSQCVDCHMPGKLYMVNDYRHDHSLSIPNPAHSAKLGSPDACAACHKSNSSKIAEQFKVWYGDTPVHDGGYADAISAARHGSPGAARMLMQQLARTDLPAIRRATVLAQLPVYPSQRAVEQAAIALNNPAPEVRSAAIDAIAGMVPGEQYISLLTPRLSDPVRAVRMAAASHLANLPAQRRAAIDKLWRPVIEEYEAAQNALRDRAEANLNLAMLYQNTGRAAQSEAALREALQRNPDFLPAVVSLAQLLDAGGQHAPALQLLNDAIASHPTSGLLQHSLGLMLIRAGDRDNAIAALAKAAVLSPEDPQFSYIYAIALHDTGKPEEARNQLEALLKRQPANRHARMALISYWHEAGQPQKVQVLQAELEQQNPDDPELQQAPNK